jgi:hypothetical protein
MRTLSDIFDRLSDIFDIFDRSDARDESSIPAARCETSSAAASVRTCGACGVRVSAVWLLCGVCVCVCVCVCACACACACACVCVCVCVCVCACVCVCRVVCVLQFTTKRVSLV